MKFDTIFHGLLRKRVIRGDPWSKLQLTKLSVAPGGEGKFLTSELSSYVQTKNFTF
jgi:hypothetical protein